MPSPTQRHVLSALVQNVPGVLAHISGMLASRGFNIDSLAVGETENKALSRMTFVVVGDDRVLEQVRKQLEKIVTVVRVIDVSSRDFVERDLLLVKVQAPSGPKRAEIRELVDIFRGRIVDVGPEELMIEISGRENKVQAFIERVRPYGITELVRTGRIAMVRSQAEADSPDLRECFPSILPARLLRLQTRWRRCRILRPFTGSTRLLAGKAGWLWAETERLEATT